MKNKTLKEVRVYTLFTLNSKSYPNILNLMYNDFKGLLCLASYLSEFCHFKKWRVYHTSKTLQAFLKQIFIFTLPLWLIACSAQPKIITQKVYIPIKCNISFPKKAYTQNTQNFSYVIDLAKSEVAYRLELENALKFCIGGKTDE
ncbi:hypothetical protein [Helicobacter sp. 13S00477-4]|uniref:hypothetical protein n=1 Tax=Helicobacter sp. 13S00477-4 TaxID=1905759 RepID=UPI000BA7CA02|nr:hypothetical protein [Helicobacter sp. 13S00477-4]PAF52002.1 hypothetical protein BKH44_04910 [Helicobacter sp. 13S00477-4]